MKGKISLILAALIAIAGTGAADSYYCPPGSTSDCGGFWVRADYLYWRACLDGGAIAVREEIVGGERAPELIIPELGKDSEEFLFTNTTIGQNVKYLPDEWDSGFRIGVGYRSGESSCDYAFNWTRYTSSGSRTVKKDESSNPRVFIPLALGPIVADVLVLRAVEDEPPLEETFICDGPIIRALTNLTSDFVKGHWDLDLDLYDFEFGHSLCCGCLALRPHASIRYASIDQHLNVKTAGDFTLINCKEEGEFPVLDIKKLGTYNATQKFDHEFCGVGPRVGLGAQYEIGCGWGVFGNFAAALLYGEREAKHREKANRFVIEISADMPLVVQEEGTEETNFIFKQSNDRRCTSANTDVEVGLFWQTTHCWGSCNYGFELSVGWEHHYFFGQGISNVVALPDGFKEDRHDLSTQGLTVTAAIGF